MFTYVLTTDLGRVRLLIPDRVDAGHVFEDEEIEAFLEIEGSVQEAAALALEIIAADQAMVLKVMKLLDLQTDGARVAESLLKRAEVLRQQAAEAQAGTFDWAEMITTDFAARERLINESLRGL